MYFSTKLCFIAAAFALASTLGGCTGMIVGGAAVGGVAVVQERSVGDAIDDATIGFQINTALLEKDEVLFRKVEVTTVEGRVVLTGAVPSADMRIEATRIAWQPAGVREVNNELQVTDQNGFTDYAKDTWITTQLRTKILTDGDVFDVNFSVETVNGTVYLLGIARTQSELDRVTDHARNIRGVAKVVSHVRVKDATG